MISVSVKSLNVKWLSYPFKEVLFKDIIKELFYFLYIPALCVVIM